MHHLALSSTYHVEANVGRRLVFETVLQVGCAEDAEEQKAIAEPAQFQLKGYADFRPCLN